jgi:selenocysteine lyase/cysteine desulfurase
MLLREDRLGDFRPSYLRYGTFDTAGYVTPPPGAARYEMGETYGPAVVAFERGLQWLRDDVGLPWLAKRNLALGKRCLEGLKKIKGVTIGTPEGNASGLVCFNIPGMHPQAVSERIRERGHVIRFVDQRPSEPTARISTSWWTTEHELDDLLNAIDDLARKARS